MSADNNNPQSGREDNTEARPVDQGIERFARYTAPAMLAILASSGQNAAAQPGSSS